jgi:hypothetical protein
MERHRALTVQNTERRLAEKELDSILDAAIVEFEEEAALEAKVKKHFFGIIILSAVRLMRQPKRPRRRPCSAATRSPNASTR